MKKKPTIPQFFINGFYESKFKDNLFVIKAGGKIIEDEATLLNLVENIKHLTTIGIKVLFVYGFGKAADMAAKERGIPVRKYKTHRATDKETIELLKQVVCGTMALNVQSAFAKSQLDALNLNVVPYDWLSLKLWEKNAEGFDFGFVGEIEKVYDRAILRALDKYNVVAMPCIASMRDGEFCNMNADRLAMNLAIATKAHKLVFLSDVDGVKDNTGKTISLITDKDIVKLIESGIATDGMRIKLENCKAAMDAGVKRVHLINGFRENALKKEIFEPTGPGTMLIPDSARQAYENEVTAQKIIEGKK